MSAIFIHNILQSQKKTRSPHNSTDFHLGFSFDILTATNENDDERNNLHERAIRNAKNKQGVSVVAIRF